MPVKTPKQRRVLGARRARRLRRPRRATARADRARARTRAAHHGLLLLRGAAVGRLRTTAPGVRRAISPTRRRLAHLLRLLALRRRDGCCRAPLPPDLPRRSASPTAATTPRSSRPRRPCATLLELAAPQDYEWVERLVQDFERARGESDERALVRLCLERAAAGRRARRAHRSSCFDDVHLSRAPARRGRARADRGAGRRSRLGRALRARRPAPPPARPAQRLRAADLARWDAQAAPRPPDGRRTRARSSKRLAQRLGVARSPTRRATSSSSSSKASPYLITVALRRGARRRDVALTSFRDFQSLYVDELLGGRVQRRFTSVLEEVAPSLASPSRAAARALRVGVERGWEGAGRGVVKRLGVDAVEFERVMRLLHMHELASFHATYVETTPTTVWRDYLRGKLPTASRRRAARARRRRHAGRGPQARAADDGAPLPTRGGARSWASCCALQLRSACPRASCTTTASRACTAALPRDEVAAGARRRDGHSSGCRRSSTPRAAPRSTRRCGSSATRSAAPSRTGSTPGSTRTRARSSGSPPRSSRSSKPGARSTEVWLDRLDAGRAARAASSACALARLARRLLGRGVPSC